MSDLQVFGFSCCCCCCFAHCLPLGHLGDKRLTHAWSARCARAHSWFDPEPDMSVWLNNSILLKIGRQCVLLADALE